MTIPNLQIRRANVEDLPRLIPLWQEENLPWAELEKRFKEFQVAAGEGGELLGALGMQVAGLEGCLYGEVFLHPEQADELRDQLWERMQVIAKNHGIFRVWTQLATPFWDHNGFNPANAELLAKRPAAFPDDAHAWLFIQLREEPVGIPTSIEKEFALFKEAERARTEQVHQQARVLKVIATVIAAVVLLLILGALIMFFLRSRAREQQRGEVAGPALAARPLIQSPAAAPGFLQRT